MPTRAWVSSTRVEYGSARMPCARLIGSVPAFAVLIAVAPRALAQVDAPVVRAGEHVTIEFHASTFPADLASRLADEALQAVESAWPVFEKCLQPNAAKPGVM